MARRRMGGALSRKLVAAGQLEIDGAHVPYEVTLERRPSTRYSLTQRKAYLRIPLGTPATAIAETRAAFETWLRTAIRERSGLRAAHVPKTFADGEVWAYGEHRFRLSLKRADVKGASAKTVGTRSGRETSGAAAPIPLRITLPADADELAAAELTEKLLFRMLARKLQPSVEAEVRALNEAHYKVSVRRVKLSATTSRWGSCSTSGTLSLSTRLAGAPAFCRKAVILHELAHRIEMNHSPRFWKLVYDAMPDYDEADAWLKTHGGQLAWRRVD